MQSGHGALKSGFTNKTVVFLTAVLTSATASCLGVETFLPPSPCAMYDSTLGSVGGKSVCYIHPFHHCGSSPAVAEHTGGSNCLVCFPSQVFGICRSGQ